MSGRETLTSNENFFEAFEEDKIKWNSSKTNATYSLTRLNLLFPWSAKIFVGIRRNIFDAAVVLRGN